MERVISEQDIQELEAPSRPARSGPVRALTEAWSRETRLHHICLLSLFTAGFAVRVVFLFQPIMHDEALSYEYFVLYGLKTIVSDYTIPNNQILHTVLAHFSMMFLGNHPWTLRLPAFVAGVLIIPATYIVIRKLLSRNAALLAVALVVPSSFLIEYSTNARGYALQTLLFLLAVLAAVYVKRTGSRNSWIWLVVLSVLAFYTIPTTAYFFGALVVWLLVSALLNDVEGDRSRFLLKLGFAVAITMLVVSLLYLPVVFHSGLKAILSNQYVKSESLRAFTRGLPGNFKDTAGFFAAGMPIASAIIVFLGFIISLIFGRQVARDRVSLAVVTLLICLMLVFAQRALPPARVWLPILPLYLGFSAASLCFAGEKFYNSASGKWPRLTIKRPSLAYQLLVLLVCALLVTTVLVWQSPYQAKDQVTFRDAPLIANLLRDNLQPGDLVYVEQNIRKILQYYFLIWKIPSSYLYKWPEDLDTTYENVPRAFVIDAKTEGRPLDQALKDSNLDPGTPLTLNLVRRFPHSTIYVIQNPALK